MDFKRLLCGLCASIIVFTSAGCSKKNESISENINEEINSEVDYNPVYPENGYYTEEEYDNLGITDYKTMPYSTYKVLRYIDNNKYERIAIVNTYVNFLTDGKNLIRKYYNIHDAFSGEFILSTYDIEFKERFQNDNVNYVISYTDLLGLKKILVEKGLNEEYIDSILDPSIKKKSLNTDDVAFIYLMLVNSNERYQVKGDELILER